MEEFYIRTYEERLKELDELKRSMEVKFLFLLAKVESFRRATNNVFVGAIVLPAENMSIQQLHSDADSDHIRKMAELYPGSTFSNNGYVCSNS